MGQTSLTHPEPVRAYTGNTFILDCNGYKKVPALRNITRRTETMGEYAVRKSDNQLIKIGTCEDMLYLRADQQMDVRPELGSVDPYLDERSIRFRFPFPDEDHILPGEFTNPNRAIWVYATIPAGIKHYSVQLRADEGYLLSIPCPESHDFDTTRYPIHRNAFPGAVGISQQKRFNGMCILVCECRGCGAKFRLETLEDAQFIIDALQQKDSTFHQEIAARIIAGYNV